MGISFDIRYGFFVDSDRLPEAALPEEKKVLKVVAICISRGSCTSWAKDQPSSKNFKALLYLDRSHSFLAMCIFSRA